MLFVYDLWSFPQHSDYERHIKYLLNEYLVTISDTDI